MILTLVGAVMGVIAGALSIVILAHAFRRSVGTGVLALCVPAYLLVYAFSQFEHRQKPWLVAAFCAALLLAGVFIPLGFQPMPVRM